VGVPQDDSKMVEQVARKESDDVQSGERDVIGAKTRFLVTKCRFTRRTATLRSQRSFTPAENTSPNPESSMSRRQLSLVVVAIASLVVSACGSSPTAPRNDEPVIVVVGSGS
jgi:hypothetical protein